MIAARLLDVLLVLVLVLYLGEGWRNGILRSLSGIVGIAAGGVVAFIAVPVVAAAVPSPEWRLTASIALSVGLLAIGHLAGSAVARAAEGRDARGEPRDPSTAARLLGAVANVVAAALIVTLVAGSVAQLGVPVVTSAIGRSIVISTIDDLTPQPIDDGLARVRAAILQQGGPTVDEDFGGVDASPTTPEVDTAGDPLTAAAASVARIGGTAFACGQNQTGSGFVIAEERVITNAHVVAGVANPVVELPDGQVLDASVVYFDAALDVAVLAVEGLVARPLPLSDPSLGDQGVVDGYPHGGPFTQVPAEVLAISLERVDDIYGAGANMREVATIAADVQPGNSGGPLVALDGSVIGLVFARNADHANLGYVTTTAELLDIAAQVPALEEPVTPGRCTTG